MLANKHIENGLLYQKKTLERSWFMQDKGLEGKGGRCVEMLQMMVSLESVNFTKNNKMFLRHFSSWWIVISREELKSSQ